jgi:hypothetical protein
MGRTAKRDACCSITSLPVKAIEDAAIAAFAICTLHPVLCDYDLTFANRNSIFPFHDTHRIG